MRSKIDIDHMKRREERDNPGTQLSTSSKHQNLLHDNSFLTTIILQSMSSPIQNQFISPQQQQRLYFITLLSKKQQHHHRELAQSQGRKIVEQITGKIEKGRFKIGQKEMKIEDLLEVKELSQSVKRIIMNRKRIEQRNKQHRLLYPNSKSFETLSEDQYPHNILSIQKHKEFMREVKLQKFQREHKISQIKQQETIQKQRSLNEAEKLKEQERISSIQKKKMQIQLNLQKMRENHQKLVLNERQTRQIVNKIRHRKGLHEYLKQAYERKMVLPILQQNKRILKQRKKNSLLNLSEIQTHQKEYLQWKKSQQSLQKSSASKSSYHPPARSKKMSRILAEEQQKKHTIEKQKRLIRQKIERVTNYTALVKQKKEATPAISKTVATTDRDTSQREVQSQHRGNLKTNHKNKYLQQARKVLRKRAKTEEAASSNTRAREKAITQSSMEAKKLQRSKKQQIQRMLNCQQLNQSQRLKRIKEANEKIEQQINKKQQKLQLQFDKNDHQSALNLLLATTKAKLNLLKCYDDL